MSTPAKSVSSLARHALSLPGGNWRLSLVCSVGLMYLRLISTAPCPPLRAIAQLDLVICLHPAIFSSQN